MNPVINLIDRKNGFTLVELLTVISIILILAALVVPAVNRMRDGAATAGCASNIRQCIAMSLMFAAEQNGRLPKLFVADNLLPGEVGKTPLPIGEKIVNNPAVSWWPDLITTYGEGASMISCPKLKTNATVNEGGARSTRVPLGIGINWASLAPDSVHQGHSWKRLIHIPDTSRMVWFTDAAGGAVGDWKDRKDQPNRGACRFGGHYPGADFVMPRHGGKINVGFADGHVSLVSPTAINWGANHTDNGKYIGYTGF